MLRFPGGFKIPLDTEDGSVETALRYPNDAAQGGWVEVKKARYTR